MTTLVTVLRSGGVYTAEWVARLQRSAEKHLRPDRFVCLSDCDVPCERIPLLHKWPGWWSKAELWRPGLFEGLVLYVDLDTLLLGDATALWTYPGRFAALRDFYQRRLKASGVMLWRANQVNLYERALKAEASGRDPGFLRPTRRMDLWWNPYERPDVLQDAFPGMIGSYKADSLQKGPGRFSVVCFHGKPRPCDAPGWVAREWAA